MTTYTPTPEAVEAAARALWSSWNPNGPAWRATSEEHREQARTEARAALTAAGPIIAAEALREAAETLRAEDMGHDRWYADGLEHRADRIVRLARGEGS